VPEPEPDQFLIRVRACGVCRTDLHLLDGDLPNPKPAVIPGHEVVRGERTGTGCSGVKGCASGELSN
jgi:propanol-preferring alcohol dehydrogenase